MTSRLLKIIGLFCKWALWKRPYSAKETCNLKEPTNGSHPIFKELVCRQMWRNVSWDSHGTTYNSHEMTYNDSHETRISRKWGSFHLPWHSLGARFICHYILLGSFRGSFHEILVSIGAHFMRCSFHENRCMSFHESVVANETSPICCMSWQMKRAPLAMTYNNVATVAYNITLTRFSWNEPHLSAHCCLSAIVISHVQILKSQLYGHFTYSTFRSELTLEHFQKMHCRHHPVSSILCRSSKFSARVVFKQFFLFLRKFSSELIFEHFDKMLACRWRGKWRLSQFESPKSARYSICYVKWL